jgi:hypothetical protein
MGEPLISYLQKFTDNAHVGKIVTDIGSGFILGLGFAFWLGITFDVTVLPYHQRYQLEVEKGVLDAKVHFQSQAVAQLVVSGPAILREESGVQLDDFGLPIPEISAFIKSQFDLVHPRVLGAMEAERLRDFPNACATLEPDIKKTCEEREATIIQVKLFQPRLNARVALLHDYKTRRDAVAAELERSTDIWKNIEHLFNQLEILVFIGGLIGVLVSQVSRQIVLRWAYNWQLRKRGLRMDATDRVIEAIAKGDIKREQHDLLVSDYFRYAEASANMVIPTLVFGTGFAIYLHKIAPPSSAIFLASVIVITFLSAVVLGVSGLKSNESYLRKVERLLEGAKQSPTPKEIPPAPPPQ